MLPDDLYVRVACLIRYTFPHRDRPAQGKAKRKLHRTLTRGTPDELVEALRGLKRAFVKDANGRDIPRCQNRVALQAAQLAGEIEGWMQIQKPRRKVA